MLTHAYIFVLQFLELNHFLFISMGHRAIPLSFPSELRRVSHNGRKYSQVLSGLKCDFEVPETPDETGSKSSVMSKWGHDQHLGGKKNLP